MPWLKRTWTFWWIALYRDERGGLYVRFWAGRLRRLGS